MRIGIFFVLGLLLACSGDDTATGDAGDSSAPTDAPHDTTTKNDASDAADEDVKTASAYSGYVLLRENKGATTSYDAFASFVMTPDGGTTAGCMQTAGSCCLQAPTDGGAPPSSVSAGTITVKYAAQTIATLVPSGTTYAATSSGPWVAGDLVNVLSTGDTVHALNGSVATALVFSNVAPALATGITMSKSQSFTITWTAATGAARVLLTQDNAPAVITCSAPTDPGTMTIDASLLAGLSSATGTIALYRATVADASPDNADVSIVSEVETTGVVTFTN
jgi:hypothetical protein